jgi:hypothetical protein
MSFASYFSRVAGRARASTRYGRLLAVAFLSATLVGTSACGDDDSSGPGDNVEGTYSLRSATSGTEGGNIPTTIFGLEVTGGELVLDNGDYSVEINTDQGTIEDSGFYDVDGNTITFEGTGEGTISGSTITVPDVTVFEDGTTVDFVFRK